jgi:hypothetical protein
MNAQFNYEIATQRAADLARVGAHHRIANEIRGGRSDHGVSASSRRGSGGLPGSMSKLRSGRTTRDATGMTR